MAIYNPGRKSPWVHNNLQECRGILRPAGWGAMALGQHADAPPPASESPAQHSARHSPELASAERIDVAALPLACALCAAKNGLGNSSFHGSQEVVGRTLLFIYTVHTFLRSH